MALMIPIFRNAKAKGIIPDEEKSCIQRTLGRFNRIRRTNLKTCSMNFKPNPLPGEKILDACAAPGGKSTHIAELINNDGKIWSVDRSSRRSKKISDNSERLGTNCLQLLVADSNELLVKHPEWKCFFDRLIA